MAGVWKRDGTVAVTNGSKKVTGTGTTFADAKNGVAKGHLFCMTTGTTVDLYEVDYVVSNTELHLVQAFRGTTGTGKAYEIITTFSDSIPEFARKLNASLSYYQSQSDMVQQLFTSDAAEITVTAPDGTTHKLIPWKRVTSEGEGQAARAKVEADRSKTEADRAVTEADRAAGIVAAAALPLPDVWAPLSDSLRLITGYGRDVLVGSDVVARMVNFSRNSTATYIGKDGQRKTAAANEPRFEKEGLLIEGQSTNLFPWSQEFIGKWARVDAIASPDSNFPNAVALKGGAAGYVHTSAGNLTIGAAYTITAIVTGYVEGATQLRGRFANSPQESHRVVGQYGPYTVLSFSLGSAANSNPNVTGIYWEAGYANGVTLCAMQIEALPFASSYIPTAGAAVTRAADVCSVQLAGNFVVPATIGCNYNLLSANRSGLAPAQLLGFKAGDKTYDGLRVNTSSQPLKLQSLNESDGWLSPGVTCQLFGTAVFRAANGVRNEFSSGAFGVPTQGDWKGQTLGNTLYIGRAESSDNARYFFGHIRNLRIWHRALTDNQIKAVA